MIPGTNWNSNFLLVFVLLNLSFNLTKAQTVVSTSDIIIPLLQSDPGINYNAQLDFLSNTNQNLPIVEKLEFRTESSEFDLGRQEYVFRTGFNSFKSRKIQKRINQNTIGQYKLRDKIIIEDYLADQLEMMIEIYYASMQLEILQDEEIILKDRQVVYKKLLGSSETIELIDLLKIEQDLQELTRDQLKFRNIEHSLWDIIAENAKLESSMSMDTSGWVSVKSMAEVLSKLKGSSINTTEQTLQATQLTSDELNYEFEVAESQKLLDFLQIKYAGRETPFIKKEISFGAGINIPNRSNERLNINEAKIDLLDRTLEQKLAVREIENELSILHQEFEQVVSEYELLSKQEKEQNLSQILNTYINSGLAQPLSLLQIKKSMLDFSRKKLSLEHDACEIYFEILKTSGRINVFNPINYLSDKLQSLQ